MNVIFSDVLLEWSNPLFFHRCTSPREERTSPVELNTPEHLTCHDFVVICSTLLSTVENREQDADVGSQVFNLGDVHVARDSIDFGVKGRLAQLHRVQVRSQAADLAVRVYHYQIRIGMSNGLSFLINIICHWRFPVFDLD